MATALLTIQLRNGTAAEWTSADPTLLVGEVGYETDTGFWKWGDGSTAWSSLTYDAAFGGVVTLANDLVVNEAADHTTAVAAGKGLFWIRSDTPNVPMFTNDGDEDFVLNESPTSPFLLMGG